MAGISNRLAATLDWARAIAACYVVLHHVAGANGWSHGVGLVFRFGQEAVLVFFLLSGFVIFANEKDRAIRPKGYFLRRLRRIYPPLIVAILVSTVIAYLNHDISGKFSQSELWGTIFGLQDISALKPGVIVAPYLGNAPLWSLSYEIFFYLVFPFVLLAWRKYPNGVNHAVGLICTLLFILFAVHPNHFSLVGSYFLVWWAGAMAANAYTNGDRSFLSMPVTYGWLVIISVVSAVVVYVDGYKGVGEYPFLMFRHFAVAVILLTVLFGPIGGKISNFPHRWSGAGSAIASISYGLYVLHYPFLVQWKISSSLFGFIFAILILLIVSYVTERLLPRVLISAPKS